MKILFQILILLLLISCQGENKSNSPEFCNQEVELFKGNTSFTAQFDFNLSEEQQIENLQKQVGTSLCHGGTPINGIFQIDESSIETLLMIDWYCVDSTNYLDERPPLACLFVLNKF